MYRRAVPAVVLVPLLVVALVVSGSACGTVASMVGTPQPASAEPAAPPVYGGVRVHVRDMSDARDVGPFALAVIDLPLCVAADTLLLPVTGYMHLRAIILRYLAESGSQSSP